MNTLDLIGLGLVAASTLPATGVVVLYMTLPWWASTTGRVMMCQSLALALLVDCSVLSWLGILPAPHVVQLVVFALVFIGAYGALILMWCARRRAHNRQEG